MPSLSVELDALIVTVEPATALWSGPALATGGSLTGVAAVILTMHVSVAASPPLSVTVNWKVRDVPLVPAGGAVKVGLAAEAFERATAGPAVLIQEYDAMVPSLSVELEPLRVTVEPATALWSGPALATGVILPGVTFTMQVSLAVRPAASATVSSKVMDVPLAPADGAVKVGLAAAAFEISYGRSGRPRPGIGGDASIRVS